MSEAIINLIVSIAVAMVGPPCQDLRASSVRTSVGLRATALPAERRATDGLGGEAWQLGGAGLATGWLGSAWAYGWVFGWLRLMAGFLAGWLAAA